MRNKARPNEKSRPASCRGRRSWLIRPDERMRNERERSNRPDNCCWEHIQSHRRRICTHQTAAVGSLCGSSRGYFSYVPYVKSSNLQKPEFSFVHVCSCCVCSSHSAAAVSGHRRGHNHEDNCGITAAGSHGMRALVRSFFPGVFCSFRSYRLSTGKSSTS